MVMGSIHMRNLQNQTSSLDVDYPAKASPGHKEGLVVLGGRELKSTSSLGTNLALAAFCNTSTGLLLSEQHDIDLAIRYDKLVIPYVMWHMIHVLRDRSYSPYLIDRAVGKTTHL